MAAKGSARVARKPGTVYRFRITLLEVDPPVWRTIEVPAGYSYWDLHVAIQDAMGWLDYHLHAFRLPQAGAKRALEIGIPGEDFDIEAPTLPGWERAIATDFNRPGMAVTYEYDFGDGWVHEVLLEGILLADPEATYPRCVAGERACPPEDCGGPHGFPDVVAALADPKHPEHKETAAWLRGHAKDYMPYDPARFVPGEVVFSDPRARWKKAFAPARRR